MDDYIDEQAADEPATQTIKLEKAFMAAKVLHSSETELCAPKEGMHLKAGDYIVLATRYGKDLGKILGPVHEFNMRTDEGSGQPPLREVVRIASAEDLKKYEDFKAREEEAFAICKQKIFQYGLDMKLVSAHYIFDETKILFFFTAEARVDFRELVKDLVAVFKMRIELRQIGVRDESRVIGGVGVCGCAYCCHGMTDKLKPVSIKMAKVQNLSLNSMKISGPCGRLLCCLAYEHGFYIEQRRLLPNEGAEITFDGVSWKITEVNAVQGIITMNAADGRILRLPKNRFEKKDSRWTVKK
jgi:cell fate regulator YaaT (PSP1 superfamily)